jgi:hypothetical protein
MIMRNQRLLPWLLVLLTQAQSLQAATIGIMGDSISTGGASHPSLAFDMDRLAVLFESESRPEPDQQTLDFLAAEGVVSPPNARRLDLSPREFSHPLIWIFNSFVTSVSSQYLDSLDNAWGTLLGRLRGNDEIFVAARDGEKSLLARQQIDRILDGVKGEALDHLFIFYTGNDLCGAFPEAMTSPADYSDSIEEAVRYYIMNAKPKRRGSITHIWLVSPLNVSQLVTSQTIQSKRVLAFGKQRSCKELQADQFDKDLSGAPSTNEDNIGLRPILAQIFRGGPHALCPTLFAYHDSNSLEALQPVSDALSGYRRVLVPLAKRLNDINPLFRVQNLSSVAPIEFEAEDIANDCFHLSVKGQMKVAKTLRSEMEQKIVP